MKYLFVLFFILSIFFSACSIPQYLSVPVNYDAKYALKPDTTTIVLINKFDFTNLKISSKRKLDAVKAGAFSAIKYAGLQFTQIPHVRVINLVDSATMGINADSARMIANQYHSDYVLALTNFSANIVLDEIQSSTTFYNSAVAVNFTLFEGNGVFYRKLAGAVNEPQSSGVYLGLVASLVIHPTIGGNKESINISAQHATQIALQDYFPYTLTFTRPLYNDAPLQPAVGAIFAGHYDKAYDLLQPFLKDANPKLAGKAAYNLAVVYEAQGDIDIATEMVQSSLEKYPNDYAMALLESLKKE